MATERAAIELELHSASAEQAIQALDKDMRKIVNSTEDFDLKLTKALTNRKKYNEAHVNLTQLQKQLNKTGNAGKQAGGLRGIGFFGQQVGYLASDARYGLLGMSNNLSIIIPQFQNLQRQARLAGKSLSKELLKTLRGPTGILIALQLLIVVLPELIDYFKTLASGVSESDAAMKKASITTLSHEVKVKSLQRQLNKSNLSLEKRNKILGKLDKLGVRTKGPDGKWLDNLRDVNDEIAKNLKLIGQRAKVRALEEILVKKYTEQSEGPGFGSKLWKRIVGSLKGQNVGEIALDFVNENKSEISEITEAIDKEMAKLFDLESDSDTDFGKKLISYMTGFNLEDAKFEKNPFQVLTLEMNKAIDKAIELGASEGGPETKLIERIFKRRSAKIFKELKEEADAFTKGLIEKSDSEKTFDAEDEDRKKLKSFYDLGILSHTSYEKSLTDVSDKYAKIRMKIAQKEREFKGDQIQRSLQTITSFLKSAALLDRKNKGLAKSAIIADAAVASIGIWRDYHGAKNTIPAPFNTITALATIGTLGVSTVKAIQSIDNQSAPGGGTQSGPSFNLIGSTGTNQLEQIVDQRLQEGNSQPVKAFVVESEIEAKQMSMKQVKSQASLG